MKKEVVTVTPADAILPASMREGLRVLFPNDMDKFRFEDDVPDEQMVLVTCDKSEGGEGWTGMRKGE